jgi:hypothetical protein
MAVSYGTVVADVLWEGGREADAIQLRHLINPHSPSNPYHI